ncbi:MAG TPA: pyrroloquinoline quinone biosynthesis peptide chaperone PqqD [Opitutaceae bacterium]|nr:pyrroloquinoline quinone biosynthesis peptide chaperone PqqD [Opitutaceae bacterium]
MSPLSLTERPKLSPRARLQSDKVTGRPILLYPEGVLVLNPTGQAILGLCTGELTLQEIIARLAADYQAPAEHVSKDVIAYLDRLRAINLLETPATAG